MAKKRYIITSTTEFVHTFRMDKLVARVHFQLNATGQQSEAIVEDSRSQFLIEKSKLFEIGFITLAEDYGSGKKAILKKGGSKPPVPLQEFEAETREEVMEILKAAGKKPKSFEGIRKAIEELGYSFPNVDFEAWEIDFAK